jgi:hypothetical protein
LSAYLDTSILLPTLIAEPMTEAVYGYLGANRKELLISDFCCRRSRIGAVAPRTHGATH